MLVYTVIIIYCRFRLFSRDLYTVCITHTHTHNRLLLLCSVVFSFSSFFIRFFCGKSFLMERVVRYDFDMRVRCKVCNILYDMTHSLGIHVHFSHGKLRHFVHFNVKIISTFFFPIAWSTFHVLFQVFCTEIPGSGEGEKFLTTFSKGKFFSKKKSSSFQFKIVVYHRRYWNKREIPMNKHVSTLSTHPRGKEKQHWRQWT